ncbi:MAG: hypothetical protein KDG52_02015 [Rhodocyclaceae bacterium]|nr:hypothetical protein [Rhodocyclaceae bacterium]
MHIPAVSNEAISPDRLLRQLRAASNEQVAAPSPSAAVTLSTDGRLAHLVERLRAGEDERVDSGEVVRLLGRSNLFADLSAALPGASPVDVAGRVVADAGAIGRGEFDPASLAALLRTLPDAASVLRSAVAGAAFDVLLQPAGSETAPLPARVRLYVDNGGVAGVAVEAARQPDLFAQAPPP